MGLITFVVGKADKHSLRVVSCAGYRAKVRFDENLTSATFPDPADSKEDVSFIADCLLIEQRRLKSHIRQADAEPVIA